MPFVNIKVTDEGVTPEQKGQLIKGVTDLLHDVLGKDPDSTFVVIDEVPLTDWGVGGVNVAEYRARRAALG
ncbi:tautomerase family protein [Nocardia mangyaensis]|uniref:tautomerase family protein n=1 Tax=Nocardia mangyaensis TaxID=2213200 RepID=UPI002675DCEC|nr:4-oxalocrotonate tautomerase family protein [Nocardia mangyaensis]MDO3649031.1 4-oxalocrotonate tautomerase family protein [Nocardia mangyaensis]